MTINSLHRNLVLDVQGRNIAIKPGETTSVERELILHNRSDRPVHVDLWIEPSDAKAMPLRQWCQFSDLNPVVEKGKSKTVYLSFNIPSQAEPGFYSYTVCAQTPEYIEEIERRPQQLEVLTSDQDISLRNEPVFYLTPPTCSVQPYQLKAGSTFKIQVTAENKSKRVDRLFLTCPELQPDWFDIEYPETITDSPGQVTQTDGLQLNPDSSGSITLKLHPPQFTPAGQYSTTLRLTSANQNNLVLLDILYFTLQVNDQVTLSLEPKVGHVPGDDSDFGITVHNVGNIRRDLTVHAQDGDRLFHYSITPNPVVLAPGTLEQVIITPKSRKWWRRLWKSRQTIPFTVELTNTIAEPATEKNSEQSLVTRDELEQIPLNLPGVPKPLDGKIIWEARPGWLRWLLIIALFLGATALVYWLVKVLVVNPSLQPKVLEFSTPNESYKSNGVNPIPLDWEISNANKLSDIQASWFSRDDKTEQSLSLTLALVLEQDSCKTEVQAVRPVFQLLYRLYGETPETNVLTCQGLQIDPSTLTPSLDEELDFGVGAYDITLTVLTLKSGQTEETVSENEEVSQRVKPEDQIQSDNKKIRNIQVAPSDPPEILYFYSTSEAFREPKLDTSDRSETSSTETSGETDEPTQIASTPVTTASQVPDAPVELTWIIDRPSNIESLTISYIAVEPGGNVRSESINLPMAENGFPDQIGSQCSIDAENRLICRNVQIPDTLIPGEYTFTLTAVMPPELGQEDVVQEMEPIEVRPPFPSIQSFKINGKQAADQPQQVLLLNPARGGVDVMLEWEVENPERMQVELLPAPGSVTSDITSMAYTLSPTPGNTNLTLQVTNAVGEMVRRTVVLATAMPSAPAQPILPVPMAPPSGIPLPPPPSVLQPEDLEPIQIPPSGN